MNAEELLSHFGARTKFSLVDDRSAIIHRVRVQCKNVDMVLVAMNNFIIHQLHGIEDISIGLDPVIFYRPGDSLIVDAPLGSLISLMGIRDGKFKTWMNVTCTKNPLDTSCTR